MCEAVVADYLGGWSIGQDEDGICECRDEVTGLEGFERVEGPSDTLAFGAADRYVP